MAESRQGDIFQPGDLLNNTYQIDKVLGRGGTSEVYKARNEISGRYVAIKVLKSEFAGDEAFLTLMRREEEIREIRHDAVVRYSENHRTPDGLIYLVMDYVDGPGLDALLKAGGLPADDLVRVCRRVADGLKVAHDRRIIHRDLSPDNIILKGGLPDQAVIIDFGIAKDANPGAQTIVGNDFAGKYAYAAPEQLAGHTDTRSDLYALGALLLSTFRGKRPDPGANPMEVVKKKQIPLDTSGVPEPLKSLIDKLSHPDPAQRFQSADEVLRAIDHGMPANAAADLDERTVLVPRPQPASAETVPANPYVTAAKPAKAKVATAPAKKSSSGVVVALVALLAIGGGAGAYFSGLFGGGAGPAPQPEPQTSGTQTASTPTPTDPTQPADAIPFADPFALIIERPETGAPRAVGDVPSEAVSADLMQAMAAIGGTTDLTVAKGAIGETWGADVLTVIKALDKVDSWRLAVTGNDAAVTGATKDPAVQSAVLAAIGTLPGTLKGSARIDLAPQVPQFLTADALAPILTAQADCGPLALVDPPSVGYGNGQTITVAGRLARPEQQVALFDALKTVAPDLKLDLKIELLNPALCQIETTLPAAPEGVFSFAFGYGDSADDNPSGRYFVGENPVVDLVIPEQVTDGYVSVSIIDVSGNVYHLLPNLNRKENAVSSLRNGAAGPVKVRIAYPLSDNKDPAHVAFTVDATSLGKSKVVVIHSEKPLFPELRPTTESVGGFAAALKAAVDAGSLNILSLDSRILTSIAK